MSIEKNMNTRIQHKHDTEANWNKAVNFIPKAGELIVYDIDENYNYARFKIGDGVRTINNLEFSQTDISVIVDVTQLPTEDIREDCFYRLLTGSLVFNQFVQNTYTIHCVDTLPETGEPATNLDQTQGNVYYNVSTGEAYGYVDDMLSAGLSVPVGWYDLATLLGALGFGYSGVITNIMDDPKDNTFRLLLEYVIYSYKDSWTSHKTIGWAGTGPSSEIFNDPMNIASGVKSHAEGDSTTAEGDYSHAEGGYSHAEGYYSHAEGGYSHAEGHYSHAEGGHSHAEGDYSHAEGLYSHAEGYSSHAEGGYSHAEGIYSHAEGGYSHAEGLYSHAEGLGNYLLYDITGEANATTYSLTSTNNLQYLIIGASVRNTVYIDGVPAYSIAKIVSIDKNNLTITLNRTLSKDTALNNTEVLIYYSGIALGDISHSEGNQTIAAGRSQHTQGEFNVVDPKYDVNNNSKRAKYAHIVGNGTSEDNRSNAHTLDWAGNAWFQGEVYIGGTSQDDENAERLAKMSDIPSTEGLATESYVDSAVASLVNAAPDTLNTLNELAAALGDDANFATTVTNQMSSKLDASELPAAINDALAQAKASGEFDGADGTSVTHSWSGTTLTITSASGTSSADLKGEKGDAGAAGKDGADGATGSTGPQGQQGPKGDPGYTPQKGVDYFTEADKAEMVEAVLESMDGIPSYWQTALDNGVEAINTALCEAGRNKSAFLFYSDVHWNYGSQMSPTLLKYLYNHTAMTKTFFGGDIVNDEPDDDTVEDFDEMSYLWDWRKQLKDLPNHHSVVGNHDDGNPTTIFDEKYVYGYLLAAEETSDIVRGDSGLYYYIDSVAEKTRYLFLDTAFKGVDAAQESFITESLKSTPTGWHIVAVSHIWYQGDYDAYYNQGIKPIPIAGLDANATKVITILDNYNARNGEFASCGAKVEFCIGGHVHVDYVDKTPGGIPIIIVETDSQHVRGTVAYAIGTTTESSVNGIIADYDANKLNIIRVGRGVSSIVDLTDGTREELPDDVPETPSITNVLDSAGYKENYRLSGGSGDEVKNAGTDISGFIPFASGQTLYLRDVAWKLNDEGYGGFVGLYKEDKSYLAGYKLTDEHFNTAGYAMEVDENGYITKTRINATGAAYIRVCALDINENSVITVDEPIPDDYVPSIPDSPSEPEATYTNLIPTAVDVDGVTIYNGKGYKENVRMSGSSGEFRDNTGSCCTGYMKIPESGMITVRMKNIVNNTFDNYGCGFYFFNGTGVACTDNVGDASNLTKYYNPVYDENGNVIEIMHDNVEGWTHMVISAVKIDDTSIITVNEPFYEYTDSETTAYTNVLNTVGYTKGIYLSNGNEGIDANAYTTGYIPVENPSITTIYLKNITMLDESTHGNRVACYDSNKTFITGSCYSLISSSSQDRVFDEEGNLIEFQCPDHAGTKYIRLSAWNIDETSIITLNEPIE